MDGLMSSCPFCGKSIIEGVEVCDECGQPVEHMYKTDPATSVERNLTKDRVHLLTPKQPLVVTSDTPVGKVLDMMISNSIGCALVVDGDNLAGVFSERDALIKLNVEAAELSDQPVSQFMTTDPESLEADVKIAFAVHRMDLGGYRHVPIVSADRKLTGIISVRDILRYLSDQMSKATP